MKWVDFWDNRVCGGVWISALTSVGADGVNWDFGCVFTKDSIGTKWTNIKIRKSIKKELILLAV